MRDLLGDLEAGRYVSDADPIRRAQNQMRMPAAKRFYAETDVAPGADGFHPRLDGKPVLTPARAAVMLPTEAAAQLIAAEFAAQGAMIEPVTMPVTRLVNTALDGVSREPDAVAEDILRFAASDLLFYRADGPEGLVERQSAAWDPVIDWARDALGARFHLAEGVVHVEQPREAVAAVALHLRTRRDPLRLAALHLMTSITGSALLALAVEGGALDPEQAWQAAHVDETWNEDHWGADSEAVARRNNRKRDFLSAVRLIEALQPGAA
ncbi:MAG: ATPase [Rhizobiaceae bacterium]|nr:ATPase [Rhizobiaceae bacterium]